MSLSGAWRRLLRLPASPSDLYRDGNRSAPRRDCDCSDRPLGCVSAADRGIAGALDAVRQLGHGVVPTLLCLTLLAGVATQAYAQTLPAVSFESPSLTVGEWRDSGVRIWLTLDPAPTSDIVVKYTVGGTATAGSDYFRPRIFGSLKVQAGTKETLITVFVTRDSAEEDDETVIFELAGGAGYRVGSVDSHTLTIADDDRTSSPRIPVAWFPSSRSVVGEDAGTHEVTVRLSPAPTSDISLDFLVAPSWGFNGWKSTLGADYTVSPIVRQARRDDGQRVAYVRIPVPAGATTAVVPFTIVDDRAQERNELVVVHMDLGQGYAASNQDIHTFEIIDNDGPSVDSTPVASFASASQSADEGSGTSDVTVNLSPAPASDITLSYTVGGTATAGSDFTIANSGTVTVPAGATTATIPVTLIDDSVQEGSETIVLKLAAGSGYKVGSSGTHTLTIAASDPPVASFASASQSADEGSGTSDVTVNLSPAPLGDITLSYTVDGTATAGTDYTALSGTVTVSRGATTATIPVTLIDDSVQEGSKTVVLTLAAGADYKVGSPDTHTLTVLDNETPPTVSFEPLEGRIVSARTSWVQEGSGTHDLKVTLNKAPASALKVKYTVSGSAAAGADYVALSGTVTVPAGATTATIPVTIVDDDRREHAEEIALWLVTDGPDY
ncbi:MAG: hypothetical protein OXI95_09425, partial [bacterium]|nr:hypothetical protein [bacterium]